MMDKLDKFIRQCAVALHEAARQGGVQRRHAKERESEIKRYLSDLEDRILLHFPQTKRESRLDLNDRQFAQLRRAEANHRYQLMLSVVSRAGMNEDGPGAPVNELGERLDF
jgi:hypothetical protein